MTDGGKKVYSFKFLLERNLLLSWGDAHMNKNKAGEKKKSVPSDEQWYVLVVLKGEISNQ